MGTLQNVGRIDWVSRGLPQMPQWLCDLTSINSEVRVAAYETLDSILLGGNFLEHPSLEQVFGSDIPVLIAPFLVGLLQQKYTSRSDEKMPNEYLILLLLNGLAEYALEGMLKFDTKNILYRRSKRIEQIICESLDLFISLLDHPNVKVKCLAVFTLKVCYAEVSIILNAFLERLQLDGHQDFIRAMLSIMSFFRDVIPSEMKVMTTQKLLPFTQVNQPLKIRAWATLCLVQILKADTSQETVDLLLEIMRTQTEFHIRHPLEAIKSLLQAQSKGVE